MADTHVPGAGIEALDVGGSLIVAGCDDGLVRVFTMDGALIARLGSVQQSDGDHGDVLLPSVVPDGCLIGSIGERGTTGTLHTGVVRCVQMRFVAGESAGDGPTLRIISGGDASALVVFDLANAEAVLATLTASGGASSNASDEARPHAARFVARKLFLQPTRLSTVWSNQFFVVTSSPGANPGVWSVLDFR